MKNRLALLLVTLLGTGALAEPPIAGIPAWPAPARVVTNAPAFVRPSPRLTNAPARAAARSTNAPAAGRPLPALVTNAPAAAIPAAAPTNSLPSPPDTPAAADALIPVPPPAPPPAVIKPYASDPAPRRKEEEPFFDTTTWPLWAEEAWETTSDAVHDRLRVGLRYRRITLTDNSRTLENSYLGSITELNTLDDYDAETWLTFDWLFNPYAGIRFNMEQVRAQTSTTSWDNHTDGDIDLKGPQLTFLLRLPNTTRFTPTAGIGYAWLTSTFEHNPMWYNGFGGENKEADYAAWLAAGSPPWPNRGYRREILLDDTTALILMGGLEVRLTDHLDLHFFIQNMEVQEVDVTYQLSFGGNVFESQQAQFPMSNLGYGFGLRWSF